MTIAEVVFDNEQELQDWVTANLDTFVSGAFFMPGCRVTTVSGKHGVPDGFAFNFRGFRERLQRFSISQIKIA